MKKIKTLGQGTFGVVYLYETDNNKKIAVKKYLNTNKKEVGYQTIRELCLMSYLQNENIINFISVKMDGFNIEMHMEYGGMDLLSYARSIKYEKRVELLPEVVAQIMAGCEYLHKNKIMHRDMKPENVLILEDLNAKKYKIKLCDFGLSKKQQPYKHDKNTNTICTSWYKPPEVFSGTYSFNVDIWGAGCIFYEFVTLEILFFGNTEMEILKNILTKIPVRQNDLIELGLDYWKIENCNTTDFYQLPSINFTDKDIAFNFNNLIKKILVVNPAKRFSFCHLGHYINETPIINSVRNQNIDYLLKIAEEKKVNKQTLLLAINLFDKLIIDYDVEKFININRCYKKQTTINKKITENIEAIQVCCLCITSKLVDFKPTQLNEFFNIYGKTKLINYERFILDLTKFKIDSHTILDAYYEIHHESGVIIDKHWEKIYKYVSTNILYHKSISQLIQKILEL